MTIDPDRPCPHENFFGELDVHRLGDGAHGHPDKIIGYSADIRVRCADCGEPFRWIGVPAGMHPRHPACSPDETELRAPIRPASADPDFGMGLPASLSAWLGRRTITPPRTDRSPHHEHRPATGSITDRSGVAVFKGSRPDQYPLFGTCRDCAHLIACMDITADWSDHPAVVRRAGERSTP